MIGRVLDRLAAMDVVQRRDIRVDRGVPEPGDLSRVGVLLLVRVAQDPPLGGWLHTTTGHIHIEVARDQPVVDVISVDIQRDLDLVGQRLAVRVGSRVPLVVAHQREVLAEIVALELVRTGGDHVLLVLRAGVLGPRHRNGGGEHGEIVEATERLAEVEDDRLVVRRLDRLQAELVRSLVLVRAGVALEVEEVVEVRRPVRESGLVERALDAVLDVLRGDRRAILELDVLPELVGPRLGAIAGLTQRLGEVGRELGAFIARPRLEHHQRPSVVPDEVP